MHRKSPEITIKFLFLADLIHPKESASNEVFNKSSELGLISLSVS